LIDGARIPAHFLITGGIFLFFNIVDFQSIYEKLAFTSFYGSDLLINGVILMAYFLLLPPLKK
jgi:hypothetical protein